MRHISGEFGGILPSPPPMEKIEKNFPGIRTWERKKIEKSLVWNFFDFPFSEKCWEIFACSSEKKLIDFNKC